MEIDFNALRGSIIDYYGSAADFIPSAMESVSEVEAADDDELLRLADGCGIDVTKFTVWTQSEDI